MTVRPVIDADTVPIIRPSARVGTVAKLLDVDGSQIRRLIADGKLEHHRIGKRGVRVFLDSVAEYQSGGGQPAPPKPARPTGKTRAGKALHSLAMAELAKEGLA